MRVGRVTTTPLSDDDSGRGGTVADSQENLNKAGQEKMGAHALIKGTGATYVM